jgi:hypothetical protein
MEATEAKAAKQLVRGAIIDLSFKLLIVAIITVLTWPLISSTGLPSYIHGSFSSTTMAYYISWAKEVDIYGWYTPNWCGGFDLLRFYPPLALSQIYLLGKMLGSFEQGAYLAFYIAIVLFTLSVYAFTRELTGSRILAFLVSIASLTIAGYVGTIAVYWEYPRIMGEALMFYALTSLHKLMKFGDRDEAVRFGVLAGILALTHLIALVEFTLLASITFAYWLWKHYVQGIDPDALRYLFRQIKFSIAIALTISAWWLIPAIAPFGLSHYLRIKTPLEAKAHILSLGLFSLTPPTWSSTIQLPYILIGCISLTLLWRYRYRLPLLYVLSLLVLILVYGQGPRLYPTLGLFMILSYATWISLVKSKYLKYASIAVLIAMTVTYGAVYMPSLRSGLSIDNSYVYSDEYKVSMYLSRHLKPGESVYPMYGPRLHGNAWINVFDPKIKQVLSCYMEGCLHREVFLFDSAVKYGYNPVEVLRLARELNVRYLWIDKVWYMSHPGNVIKRLVQLGVLEPVDNVNKFLRYSMLFRLVGEERGAEEIHEDLFLTPSRLLGFATSLLLAILVIREATRL